MDICRILLDQVRFVFILTRSNPNQRVSDTQKCINNINVNIMRSTGTVPTISHMGL